MLIGDNSRIIIFDIAKLIAIVMVVWGHVEANLFNNDFSFVNMCHMPFFFFTSGYFFYKECSCNSRTKLIKKKTLRLLVPYLAWSFISLVMNVLICAVRGSEVGFWSIFIAQFVDIFIYSRSVWFIVQLYITVLFFLFTKYVSDKFHISHMLFGLCLYVTFVIIGPNDILCFYKFKWLFPFWIMGYCLCGTNKNIVSVLSANTWKGCLCLIIYILLIVEVPQENLMNLFQFNISNVFILSYVIYNIIGMFMGALGIIMILWLAVLIDRLTCETRIYSTIVEFGRYTMDVYVIHMFLIYILLLFSVIHINYFFHLQISLIASIVITVFISFFSKRILRKCKIYRILVGEK